MGANSHPLPSAFMMNGESPAIAAIPLASLSGRYPGSLVASKSGTSGPAHFFASASHHIYFLRSDQGLPSASADARLYIMRRFSGHEYPHSGLVGTPGVRLRERDRFTPSSGKTPL